MSADQISLKILTPEKIFFDGKVATFIAPAYEGLLGVLPGHAPLLCSLGKGTVVYEQSGARKSVSIRGGFMEVDRDQAVILADHAEEAG